MYNLNDLENVKLVTHKNCLDGSASAVIFLAAGGKQENIYFSHPNHENTDEIVKSLFETHTGTILLADVSVSYSLAKKLDSKKTDILLLDHHKSAVPLSEFDWCEIEKENKRSGALMLYDFFRRTNSSKSFVRYWTLATVVDDYDRFIREYSESEDLVTLHDFLGQDLFIERFIKNPYVVFDETEQRVLKVLKHKREKFIENKCEEVECVKKTIDGHEVKIAYVEANKDRSLLGNKLYSSIADVVVMIDGKSVSFRSSPVCSVDLSKIAQLNGGGGHEHAAATTISNILGEDFIKMIFERIKWE